MIMPNRATVLLILLLKKWIFCKQVVGKRNWNVTLCMKRNSFCVILGTLSIDNEMHDDEEDWVEGFVLGGKNES